MPQVFKLRRGSTELNFVQRENQGWRYGAGWWPKVASLGQELVDETFDLICDANSHDEMAQLFQWLDDMRYWAAMYWADEDVDDPVYLHVKMSQESGERRAAVRRIAMQWQSPQLDIFDGPPDNTAVVRMTVTRQATWEHITGGNFPAMAEAAGAAIVYDYANMRTNMIGGDWPARIRQMRIGSDTTGARVGRLWIGIRSENKNDRNLNNFEPIWELEDGTLNDGGSGESGITDPADATASGGKRVQVVESDLDWDYDTNDGAFHKVVEIQLTPDVTNDAEDQFGLFQWLLRGKVSAADSTWDVRLEFGYASMTDGEWVRGDIRTISSTSWDIEQMGVHGIPVRARSSYYQVEEFNAVQVWARRRTGSANLHLDCLVPLPVDEGWARVWGFDIAAASQGWLVIGVDVDGKRVANQEGTSGVESFAGVAGVNFALPPGDGRMIIVYAGPTDSDITTPGIYVSSTTNGFMERWHNLRGAQ